MVIKRFANALKTMSQRALWRGDRSQSEMVANHGVEGMRYNLLRDTPTYKKPAIGLVQTQKSSGSKPAISNSQTRPDVSSGPASAPESKDQNLNLGRSILDSL